MIVVDTNVIASIALPDSQFAEQAIAAYGEDQDWAAPILWRSELCNVLATALRCNRITLATALESLAIAEDTIDGRQFEVQASEVVRMAASSGCAAYDCELVVLASELSISLVTLDKAILRRFPDLAVDLRGYAESGPSRGLRPNITS